MTFGRAFDAILPSYYRCDSGCKQGFPSRKTYETTRHTRQPSGVSPLQFIEGYDITPIVSRSLSHAKHIPKYAPSRPAMCFLGVRHKTDRSMNIFEHANLLMSVTALRRRCVRVADTIRQAISWYLSIACTKMRCTKAGSFRVYYLPGTSPHRRW